MRCGKITWPFGELSKRWSTSKPLVDFSKQELPFLRMTKKSYKIKQKTKATNVGELSRSRCEQPFLAVAMKPRIREQGAMKINIAEPTLVNVVFATISPLSLLLPHPLSDVWWSAASARNFSGAQKNRLSLSSLPWEFWQHLAWSFNHFVPFLQHFRCLASWKFVRF